MAIENPYLTNKSLSSQFRLRRFRFINPIIQKILAEKGSCRILDLGGSSYYWNINKDFLDEHRGRVSIVLVNRCVEPLSGAADPCFEMQTGDVTEAEVYKRNDFDFIHSNSVIEHVGLWPSVRKMAGLILDAGKPYFVQTPNLWFPIEPHFRFVGFQWLPEAVRARLLLTMPLGFYPRAQTYDEAMGYLQEVHLLTHRQMAELFPGAELKCERFLGLVKSIMAIAR